jgi:hypothetical protein
VRPKCTKHGDRKYRTHCDFWLPDAYTLKHIMAEPSNVR